MDKTEKSKEQTMIIVQSIYCYNEKNINKIAIESIALVLTPENHHKSHTKSLPRLHWCKMVNFGKICVFHIKSLKTGIF
jgi:hypothetical protein